MMSIRAERNTRSVIARDFSGWRRYMAGSDRSLPGCSTRSRTSQNSLDKKILAALNAAPDKV